MPFLDHTIDDVTLDDDVTISTDPDYPSATLKRDGSVLAWNPSIPFVSSGILTFPEFNGWALRLPPYTFEQDVEFEHEYLIEDGQFANWFDWTSTDVGVTLSESLDYRTYGVEMRVTKDATTDTARVFKTVAWDLLESDTLEFHVYIPSNALALSVELHDSDGDSAVYEVFSPLTDNWNVVLVEVDKPTSTVGTFDETKVVLVYIQVTFPAAVTASFHIGNSWFNRTAHVGGEVLWQVSLDNGTSWLGWDGTAWVADEWTHPQVIERYISLLNPALYDDHMTWSTRCKLIASTDKTQTPRVYGVVCAVDFDEQFNLENDLKRSIVRFLQDGVIYYRALEAGDGTNQVTLRTKLKDPVVEHVYVGGMRDVNTTTDIFSSQSGTTIVLTTTVATAQKVVIHYKANVTVKISADPFLVDSEVPEIDLVFPTINHDIRHGGALSIYNNRSLGLCWTEPALNYDTFEWEAYCVANDAAKMASMIEMIRRAFDNGFISDATGSFWHVNDMLPSEVASEHYQGLQIRRLESSSTGIRWESLLLTEKKQVRAILPSVRSLPFMRGTE